MLADVGPFIQRRQLETGAHTGSDRGIAAGPAEHEGYRRQQPGPVQVLDDLGPARYPGPAARRRTRAATARAAAGPGARRLGTPVLLPGEPQQARVDPPRRGRFRRRPGHRVGPRSQNVVHGQRTTVDEQVVHLPVGQDVLPQRYRTVLTDHDTGVPAHGHQPVGELLRVAYRRGQRHQTNTLGKMNDHFFPHGPPLAVGEIVDLVHDDEGETIEAGRLRVEHVPEDLGGHDDHRRIRVTGGVAGQEADRAASVTGDEVGVLLVRQCFDRRGVEATLASRKREVSRELTDDRLAGASRSGNQDAFTRFECVAGRTLKRIEAEWIPAREIGQCAGGGLRQGLGAWGARGRGGHLVSVRDRWRDVAIAPAGQRLAIHQPGRRSLVERPPARAAQWPERGSEGGRWCSGDVEVSRVRRCAAGAHGGSHRVATAGAFVRTREIVEVER